MAKRTWRLGLLSMAALLVGGAGGGAWQGTPSGASSHHEVEHLIRAGRYVEAESAARRILSEIERRTSPDPLQIAELLDLLVEALWREGRSTLRETQDLADRALWIRATELGGRDPLVADSLVRKADILLDADDYPAAEALLLGALRVYESAPGASATRLARVHNRLGTLYGVLGKVEASGRHARLAVDLAESSADPDEELLAEALSGLALFEFSFVRDETYAQEAEVLARRALELRRQSLPDDHPLVADSSFLLGDILFDLGSHEEALALMEGAVASLTRTLGANHPHVAEQLTKLAVIQRILGDPLGARESLERSLAILEPAPKTGLLASAYNALALVQNAEGDLLSARRSYEAALEIRERIFGSRSHAVAVMLNNIGCLEIQLEELDDARSHLERGLAIARHIHGVDAMQTVVFQLNLAEVALEIGDLEAAEKLARRAWEIEESFMPPGRFRLEAAALQLGTVLRERGKYTEAEAVLSRVLMVRERGFALRNQELVDNLAALADLMAETARCDQAVSMYEETLAILQDLYGPGHPDAASTHLKIARCLGRSGKWHSAFEQSLRAEEIAREHSRLMLTGLSERVALQYAANRPSGLDRALSLLIEKPEAGSRQEGIDAVIRSRAMVLDEMASRRRIASIATSSDASGLEQDLIRSRKRLASLAVQGPGSLAALDAFRRTFADAKAQRDRTERALAEANRGFRLHHERKAAGLDEVRASLPPRSGLVGFVQYRRLPIVPEPAGAKLASEPEAAYLAFVLKAGSTEIELVDLGPAREIESLVQSLRSEVTAEANSTLGSPRSRELAYRRVAGRLRERIWDPVEPYLADLDSAFVVPDGALHSFNLAALPIGQHDYLSEANVRLHYLSAERDLLPPPVGSAGHGLFVIGNPDFDETAGFSKLNPVDASVIAKTPGAGADEKSIYRGPLSACASLWSMRFEPLYASEDELRDVVEVWRALPSQPPLKELVRGRATETSVKRLAAGQRVLHLATHGFYLGGNCTLHEITGLRGEARRHLRLGDLEDPLLLSGLAFAGANHRRAAGPEEDDGILTAEEVAALDLLGVEWAVLSACESGLGEVRTGEGILGLRRAFANAGVRTLIMSLWPIDDDSTRQWMRSLYHHRFAAGATTIDAVNEANRDLLTARRKAGLSTHPFYWAGFVAVGDWR